jgi:histidine phosphotransferase ChpT
MMHTTDTNIHDPVTESYDSELEPISVLVFAQTMATRLCHDLAGMLGAVTGALEMINEDPAMTADALPVATDAASVLSQRLRLMRTAWGAPGEQFTTAELCEMARGLPLGRRMSVSLDGLAPDRVLSAAGGQIVLNMLILAVESLGGTGSVTAIGERTGDIVIRIDGPRATWPAGFGAMLADQAQAEAASRKAGPRHMQASYTALLAHNAGMTVSMLLAPGDDAAPPMLLSID